ncbi:hypothetical protein PY85_13545 [Lacticaseibacillus rhamnosus]|uniref:hypothetical protein n=1 Tax=Lacticaseibacillus rhamnosus TaxID=47715 RepID=UPI0004A788F6|nr:hypothetical protein [Lacticaseibacillus rhamnosus]OFJ94985.1 hypothetical protein HMPREF2838_01695 [Lactobacillus sp. HMSC066G01]OFP96159.1 hypothetical protein HMPREF2965_05750 [Lactobacillus sp. HMSC075D02]AON64472.1 hypothetical protein BFC96_13105 [Lacticaseibacillus rhamnosus]AQG73477.1 hypothetical protein AWJ15_11040 [Lacticaseibacillus rhamnosus]KFK45256.1 hypothetical protein LR24_13780 [Lacticaseibacillus rhamnosus]
MITSLGLIVAEEVRNSKKERRSAARVIRDKTITREILHSVAGENRLPKQKLKINVNLSAFAVLAEDAPALIAIMFDK